MKNKGTLIVFVASAIVFTSLLIATITSALDANAFSMSFKEILSLSAWGLITGIFYLKYQHQKSTK